MIFVIIDLGNNTKMCVYADDTALFYYDKSVNIVQSQLQSALNKVLTWINNNKLILNVKKTKSMLIGSSPKIKNKSLDFYVNKERVEQVTEFKYLGLLIDSSLRWNKHIDMICNKLSQRIGFIRRIKYFLQRHILILLYNTLVLPHLDNYNAIWGLSASYNTAKLQKNAKSLCPSCLECSLYDTPFIDAIRIGMALSKTENLLPGWFDNV